MPRVANLVALTSLGCYLTCWPSIYMGVRTYANTWETVLLIASMYFLETSVGRCNDPESPVDYTCMNVLSKAREVCHVGGRHISTHHPPNVVRCITHVRIVTYACVRPI